MADFLKKHSAGLAGLSLIGLLAVPFLLYAAAGRPGLTWVGLGLMGLLMLLVMKVG